MMDKKLKKILSSFPKTNVFVVGDLILDVFVWGKVKRISPEAPVPIVEIERDTFVPGGAANVANNIAALGGKVWIAGLVGDDGEGRRLIEKMRERKIRTNAVLVDQNRPTTIKTRVVAHHQQVVRIDREIRHEIREKQMERMKKVLSDHEKEIGGILIEDYGKGVMTQSFASYLIEFALDRSIPVAVDPKKGHLLDYRGLSFSTPNYEEACFFAGIDPKDNYSNLDDVGKVLIDKWDCQAVLITLGEKGMCLFQKNKKPYPIETRAKEVFDVSGAGDTVIGTFMTAVLSGATLEEAAFISNVAAGIVVGKLGTAVVTREEIAGEIENVR